ncbi:hypothetical protein L596_002683 [Steinernema carpocapsae]|uniref:Uncharacterized protein n=1 Tax=Steinernema carpocapsae TaxID=34508 RepID=A0A4U8USU8_STECR|nr:hypothetical protein L596_002683 [Steinernema carpocapsae]
MSDRKATSSSNSKYDYEGVPNFFDFAEPASADETLGDRFFDQSLISHSFMEENREESQPAERRNNRRSLAEQYQLANFAVLNPTQHTRRPSRAPSPIRGTLRPRRAVVDGTGDRPGPPPAPVPPRSVRIPSPARSVPRLGQPEQRQAAARRSPHVVLPPTMLRAFRETRPGRPAAAVGRPIAPTASVRASQEVVPVTSQLVVAPGAPRSGGSYASSSGASSVQRSGDSYAPNSGGSSAPRSGGSYASSSGASSVQSPKKWRFLRLKQRWLQCPGSGGSYASSSGDSSVPRSDGSYASNSGGSSAPRSGGSYASSSGASSVQRSGDSYAAVAPVPQEVAVPTLQAAAPSASEEVTVPTPQVAAPPASQKVAAGRDRPGPPPAPVPPRSVRIPSPARLVPRLGQPEQRRIPERGLPMRSNHVPEKRRLAAVLMWFFRLLCCERFVKLVQLVMQRLWVAQLAQQPRFVHLRKRCLQRSNERWLQCPKKWWFLRSKQRSLQRPEKLAAGRTSPLTAARGTSPLGSVRLSHRVVPKLQAAAPPASREWLLGALRPSRQLVVHLLWARFASHTARLRHCVRWPLLREVKVGPPTPVDLLRLSALRHLLLRRPQPPRNASFDARSACEISKLLPLTRKRPRLSLARGADDMCMLCTN